MKNEFHFLKAGIACGYIQLKTICLAFLLMTVVAGYANGRTDILLTDGWTLRPISDPTPGKRGTAVTLPHTWNASYVKDTYYNRETMVYHRTLTISETMLRNNRLFLRFEGANSVADVFVNRKHEVTDVKVYSNQKDATLYVNGNKIAKQQSDDINRIVFKDVHLSEGKNIIRVKAGKLSDECIWRFEPAEEK